MRERSVSVKRNEKQGVKERDTGVRERERGMYRKVLHLTSVRPDEFFRDAEGSNFFTYFSLSIHLLDFKYKLKIKVIHVKKL